MFCIHCGRELPDNAKFCDACGKAIQMETEAPKMTTDKEWIANKPKKLGEGFKHGISALKTEIIPKVAAQGKRFGSRASGKYAALSKGKKIAVLIIGIILLLALVIIGIENRVVAEIPDPEDFFGVRGYETSGGSDINLQFEFEEDPSQLLETYFAIIEQNTKNVWIQKSDGENTQYVVHHTGFWLSGEKHLLTIVNYGNDYYGEDGETYVVFFRAESNVKLKHWDAYDPDDAENKTQENMGQSNLNGSDTPAQAEPTAVISGPTLPDLRAFLGNPEPYTDKPAAYSGWNLCYRLSIDQGWTAGNEYVELLKNTDDFTLSSYNGTDLEGSGVDQEYYFFEYTGSEEIEPASGQYWYLGSGDYVDYEADVFVRIMKFAIYGYTEITVEYSNDLAVADFGVRASTVPQNSDGSYDSGNSDSDYYKPDASKLPCITCWGDKDCSRCDGYGTIERYNGNGETITSDCPDCVGGKCPTCNGTGTRE